MLYFVAPPLFNDGGAGDNKIRLFRLGPCALEFDREISLEHMLQQIMEGDKFITAYVYQNLFIRIAPVSLDYVDGQEFLTVDGVIYTPGGLIKFPDSWLLNEN